MQLFRPAILLLGLTAGSVFAEGASLRLVVSATVPPRPCEYPAVCPKNAEATLSASYAKIVDGRVLYAGARPAITRQDDLLTIRF